MSGVIIFRHLRRFDGAAQQGVAGYCLMAGSFEVQEILPEELQEMSR